MDKEGHGREICGANRAPEIRVAADPRLGTNFGVYNATELARVSLEPAHQEESKNDFKIAQAPALFFSGQKKDFRGFSEALVGVVGHLCWGQESTEAPFHALH